ncbi:MAG: elongation factor EF-2 [Candidatus Woesearchaeota archaeon]|jgi:elongation factor 2|nr:elongation factor EF-2 [Candidatus Woesearchaeota archaeon]MDP6648048.1 elongation factor EF-2 [Candidatus Woesearchaeota archaeon]|tara:strand:- start:267 stop:2444 length:2178 start_codon:yes stop_codon:yes gene_type:complete
MAEKMVDRVMRIMQKPTNIRNIAICAHIDHGKTTFSDNLLAGAGMMSKEDAGKALKLDFHADEQERGITIDTAAVSMVHSFDNNEYLINLLDTPGHVDFGGDVTRAMRASDGAIVVVDAVESIMPQTETVLRQALRELVKPTLFINKVDRLIKELQLTPEQMQERFLKIITAVNKLIKEIAPKGYGEKWQVNVQNGSVCFGSAFHNWALSIPYMQKKGITFKDIITAYNEGENYKELADKAPLHEIVLNMVIEHLPNPVDAQAYRIPVIWHGDMEGEDGKSLVKCNLDGPLYFIITKIVIDPQAGEISAGRLFSGTIKKGTDVYLNRLKQSSKIQQVFIYNGAKREIVDNVSAGNFVGVAGIKAYAGETITLDDTGTPFEKITHIFDPVVTKAIEAKQPSDLPKLIEVLRMVGKEDPTIQIEINEETGEHLMHGMGELHLEIIENRIRSEKGVEVQTSPPIVVYRETITKPGQEIAGKTPNKHNLFFFEVEPLEDSIYQAIKKGEIREMRIKKKDLELRDKLVECGMTSKNALKVKDIYNGNILIDMTRGQVHVGEVIEMILDMFEDVMSKGPLAHEPCMKVKVMLTDMKLHEDAIHRGPAQVYPAVRGGIRGSMTTAKPLVYEPYQIQRIEAPSEFLGEISKLISNKRGQLLDAQQEGNLSIIKAKIPVGEMFGWSSNLRSATEGRGNSSLVDQMYEKLPGELQEKIVKQIRDRKGLSETQVGV